MTNRGKVPETDPQRPRTDFRTSIRRFFRSIQPINRWRDFLDARAGRNWYAPIGTYDGLHPGRPFRHLRCVDCGGPHYGPHR